jgi:phasin family protein
VAAFTKANQVVFDGVRTLAQHNRELFTSTVGDYTQVTSDVLTGTSVQQKAMKQIEGAGRIYASSVALLNELSDIAVKTHVSTMDIFNARVTEGFDELKAMFTGRGAPTPVGITATSTAAPIDVVDQVTLIENAFDEVPLPAPGTPRSARRTARGPAKAAPRSARVSSPGSKRKARTGKAAGPRTKRK